MIRKYAVVILFLLYGSLVLADKFEPDASYKVCFTPSENCTDLIVTAISQAKKQVLVQAYSFTSAPIAKALLKAYKKGIDVKVILDKSQYRQHGFSSVKLLTDYHIPVWIDFQPAIAHNKIMIIDNNTVISGSFNFTRAAEERNAENVIIMTDTHLAMKYVANWKERASVSKEVKNTHSALEDY
jgi:phosphatidylserine/phosphatidylglycerophosphate/cardiolipin synthase-like enzyme